jgi:hypothetical protein
MNDYDLYRAKFAELKADPTYGYDQMLDEYPAALAKKTVNTMLKSRGHGWFKRRCFVGWCGTDTLYGQYANREQDQWITALHLLVDPEVEFVVEWERG